MSREDNNLRFPFVRPLLDTFSMFEPRCVYAENFLTGDKIGKEETGWVEWKIYEGSLDKPRKVRDDTLKSKKRGTK